VRILVVGGGIGGLTLAIALRQQGLRPEIVERAPGWSPAGAGIVLGINAMRLMRRLGVAAALAARGVVVGRGAITDAAGSVLSAMDLREFAGDGQPGIAIHRAALHEVLAGALRDIPVRHRTTPRRILADGDPVTVELDDGSRQAYDLVVGADGIRSFVRDAAFGPNPPIYSGYTCWRLVVQQPAEVDGTVEMWGRGRRFGLVPIGDGQIYCFATLNAPAETPDPPAGRLERFRAVFAEFRGAVPAVLAQLMRPEELIHNDLEEVRQSPWYRGRIVLLGDAAHASTPNMGQGAAMAIEDAIVLAEEVGRAQALGDALAAYVRRRLPRAGWVQEQSRRIGRVGQLEHPAACWLRNTLVRLTPQRVAAANLRRLFEQPI